MKKIFFLYRFPLCYPINKQKKTPNRGSIFTPMENNFFPSPENYNQYNNNFYYFLNYLEFQKNNLPNNYIIENPPRLYNEYNKMPLNINRESENIPTPKKINLEIENNKNDKNEIINNNITKKFYTDYGGYGYKCSCSKTNCNRYYCECFRSGLYCTDCNCKNCQNKPPENCASNRHPTLVQNKPKTEVITCTCTKSGCNKKYCECYKNGSKCNSSCRCVGCENTENGKKIKEEFYECCLANSIYIVKNKIIEEEIDEGNEINEKNDKVLLKKRKRTISAQK